MSAPKAGRAKRSRSSGREARKAIAIRSETPAAEVPEEALVAPTVTQEPLPSREELERRLERMHLLVLRIGSALNVYGNELSRITDREQEVLSDDGHEELIDLEYALAGTAELLRDANEGLEVSVMLKRGF
jgi:hypothetical protein